MNMETNITATSPAATTPISQLVAAHIEATANHNRAFDLIGWKVAKEEEFGDTIAPIDDAIIALCAARPSTPEEATLKREYLKQELYPVLNGNEGMTSRAVSALIDAGGEPEARPGSPSMVARKIATAQDNLLEAHSLNVATMLATEDLPDGPAIQAITRAVEAKLNLVRDQLEALREALS